MFARPKCAPLALAAAIAASACTGKIGSTGGPGSATPPGGGPGAAGTGAPVGPSSMPSGPGTTAPPGPTGGQGNTFIDQSSTALARLTNAEYSQTVADLLGESPDAATRYRFPDDPRQHGFDNNVTLLQISNAHGDRYAAAAEAIAAATFSDATRRAKVMACDPAAGAACLTTTIKTLGRRLYRRPLTDAEVSSFASLAQMGANAADPYSGPKTILEAMLQSPHFLFRVQIGVPDAKRPGIVGLSGYELATRLSFLLLGTSPDDALLDQAGAGGLDTPAGVAKVVQSMMADPRARRGVRRFYDQWLPLTAVPGATATDLVEETHRFVDDVLWDTGKTIPDLLTAKYTFVNANLAKAYGLPAPAAGQTWQRADFAAGSTRAGLLTQGSLMAAGSHDGKPSSTKRGQMVREQLLCQDIPSPPPGVANTPPAAMGGETEQQTFARHTTDASCAVCHKLMDPIGWGLSGFDAAGVTRTKDNNGQTLNTAGRVEGMTPPEFNGPVELGQKVATAPGFKSCFARQLFRYVYGRAETVTDNAGITELEGAFTTAGWDLAKGLTAMAVSDGLRYRNKGDAP
jgi:hypothetical protein